MVDRDQKMDDHTRCFQSSVYFEDCVRECDDSFICCPGSHMWENGPDWVTSANRDHVSVPHEDPMVREHLCKLVIKKGDDNMEQQARPHGWILDKE